MKLANIALEISQLISAGAQIPGMPRAQLEFDLKIHPEQIGETLQAFTKPHPRYRLIKNKTVGVALIDLRQFKTAQDYLDTVRKKDNAGYQARRATARGYRVCTIERNLFIDDIHNINNSTDMRQGRPMDDAYRTKEASFEDHPHFTYYGVMDKQGKLAGYCNVAVLGNFAATERLLGYKNSDGFMYLLLTEIVCNLIKQKTVSFLMYDTYLGAQPGLREFKRKVGFNPYLVRYSLA